MSSRMVYKALVPVKALAQAKSRLALHLTQSQRAVLVLDMLQHVLHVLHESDQMEQILVVSPDANVREHAEQWGAGSFSDEGEGQNYALHAATVHLVTSYAGTLPPLALLTISADLPLLQVSDIQAMIQLSVNYPIVLALSHDNAGTNALLAHPPLAIPYLFGSGSLSKFQQAASEQQLDCTIYDSSGTFLDINTVADLRDMQHHTHQSQSSMSSRSPARVWALSHKRERGSSRSVSP